MTFCKPLKKALRYDGIVVTAYEYTEKHSTAKQYEIIESKDGIALYTTLCAATTWRKRFKMLCGPEYAYKLID